MDLFDKVFKNYNSLKKKDFSGNVSSLGLSKEDINIFEKMGILITHNEKYILIQDSKIKIDFNFYCNNYHKLNKILHKNEHTRFFIHYILFNIHIYLTPDKLAQTIRNKIGTNLCSDLAIKNEDIINAHYVLLESGLFQKDFCTTDNYFEDEDKIIIIRDMWYYQNNSIKNIFEYEIPVDYIQKIMTMRYSYFL